MRRQSICLLCVMLLSTLLLGHVFAADDADAIKRVIQKSYFNGAFNELDTESMRKGFHPDFAIFSAKGDALAKYPITVWIDGIEKGKKDPNFDPARAKMVCKIVSLDITGECAAAKIEISKEDKLIYTDYLSLLKFEDGWKIAAKVYHAHK